MEKWVEGEEFFLPFSTTFHDMFGTLKIHQIWQKKIGIKCRNVFLNLPSCTHSLVDFARVHITYPKIEVRVLPSSLPT